MKKYPNTDSNLDMPALEKKVLKYWENNKTFLKSIEIRDNKDNTRESEFVFYDGPPFANGLPHYGHLLTGFIKDSYARYQTSLGKKVERKFGWDCHGLPAEMGAEKELNISGRDEIIKFGVDKFNEHCKESVMKYASKWKEYVTRQSRWVDFDGSYKTMDINYMESVLWAFKELYKKGYVYESMRVMPYSWACETPLSNFETRLDNSYRERADKSVTISFIIKDSSKLPGNYKEYRILAWTTTPWTLPSNLALAVNPEIEYSLVEKDSICYIIADFALEKYTNELSIDPTEQYVKIKGSSLKDIEYEPLFNYFANHKNAFRILLGDFVQEGDGTGIVHMAPGFGEDDQIICQANNIELVCPVDSGGKFTSEIRDLEGIQVLDSNDPIIINLKKSGNWLKTEQYIHNYPHCWRTDTPLIYKAVPSWYVEVTKFKDRMVELNQQINWIPGHIKDGLFGKWLENARDWSISRNRFFGTPIPVWKSDDPKYPRIDVYGSIKELEKDFGVKITDLHKHHLDKLTRPNPDDPTGKSMMVRVEYVFDCWFDSGSMPYGQVHYPFENKDWFEKNFPADFIVEYAAQTRGWFYTLMVLSTALFDRPPFLNCICHGVILDEAGQKLSKRLNNYADPLDTFDQYGSDPLRFTMLSSGVTKGAELLIDKEGKMVYDILRLNIKPIWNAYHFFTLYANSDEVEISIAYNPSNVLDIYIISKLKIFIDNIKSSLDNYDTQNAYKNLSDFIEVLNNWYIRRSRNRFWKTQKDQDKQDAYNVLYTCLDHISKAASSLLPNLFEEIYQGINRIDYEDGKSVHLENFPDSSKIPVKSGLVETMDLVIDICSAALFIRNKQNIRIRQPLKTLSLIIDNADRFKEFEDLIKEELNVKSVEYISNIDKHADKILKINFQNVGKRIPLEIKNIIQASKKGEWKINPDKTLNIAGQVLSSDEYELILQSKNPNSSNSLKSGLGIVELDLQIDEELYLEGLARDLIRHIQQARKEADFLVNDRINLEIITDGKLAKAAILHKDLIESQTLSNIGKFDKEDRISRGEIEGEKFEIRLLVIK